MYKLNFVCNNEINYNFLKWIDFFIESLNIKMSKLTANFSFTFFLSSFFLFSFMLLSTKSKFFLYNSLNLPINDFYYWLKTLNIYILQRKESLLNIKIIQVYITVFICKKELVFSFIESKSCFLFEIFKGHRVIFYLT